VTTFKFPAETDAPPSGFDSVIAVMPSEFYVQIDDGEPAFAAVQFARYVRDLSEDQARRMGERLHHAEWINTRDPEVVRQRGLMHDCDECRAWVEKALSLIAEGNELMVGQLWWA
jgi:hypothetical protein